MRQTQADKGSTRRAILLCARSVNHMGLPRNILLFFFFLKKNTLMTISHPAVDFSDQSGHRSCHGVGQNPFNQVDLTGWLDCLSRLARLVWHARSTVQSISDTSYGSDLWFRGRTGPLVTNGVLVRASGRSIQFQRVGAKLSIISYPNYKICDVIGKPNKNTT